MPRDPHTTKTITRLRNLLKKRNARIKDLNYACSALSHEKRKLERHMAEMDGYNDGN